MVVYEFYLRSREKGDKLIGVLPERRNKIDRINHDSIMNWIKTVYSTVESQNNIFYIQVKL